MINKQSISLYVHYPFCESKCPYCDFNSYANLNIDRDKLLECYLNEIDYFKNFLIDKKLETIYFGGGTPTLMDPKFLGKIIEKINSYSVINKSCEITMEGNPNSISFDKINEFYKAGVNRFSIGIQSLNDDNLKRLGRIHNREQGLKSIDIIQKIFKDNYSIDLIYTIPNQKIIDWEKELKEAVKLSPFHISAYQLIVERGTIFYKNKVTLPNDEIGAKFYDVTRNILETNDIKFYEISNFAKKGYECKHNLVYWNNGNWLGIGAGAHSRIDKNNKRYGLEEIKNPLKWIEKCESNKNGILRKYIIPKNEIIEEFVLMGLRTKSGLDIKNIQKNICCDSLYDILNKDNINFLVRNNLITASKNKIKIRKNNFILLNSIINKIFY